MQFSKRCVASRLHRRRFLMVLAALGLAGFEGRGADDFSNRFQSEYPAKRAEWKQLASKLPVSDVSTITVFRQGQMVDRLRYTRKERYGCFVRAYEYLYHPPGQPKKGRFDFAYVRNERYFCELAKAERGTGWLLRGMDLNAPSRIASIESIRLVSLRKSLFPEYKVPEKHKKTFVTSRFGEDFDALAATPNFQLLNIVGYGPDMSQVRVEYRNTFRDDGLQKDYPAMGWVIFDPGRYWAPCQFSFTFGDSEGQTTRERKDSFISDSRYPFVQKSEMKEVIRSGKEAEERIIDHEIHFGDDVKEMEFTLSAFGLPEPVGVVWEKSTPRYIWFLVAAGILAVLAVGFRYLVRRQRTITPA